MVAISVYQVPIRAMDTVIFKHDHHPDHTQRRSKAMHPEFPWCVTPGSQLLPGIHVLVQNMDTMLQKFTAVQRIAQDKTKHYILWGVPCYSNQVQCFIVIFSGRRGPPQTCDSYELVGVATPVKMCASERDLKCIQR